MPPRTLKAAATAYTANDDEVDYNDIQSLRAYAIRTQSQYHNEEEYEHQHTPQQEDENPQDDDWDPEQRS